MEPLNIRAVDLTSDVTDVRIKDENQVLPMPDGITKAFEFLKLPAEIRNMIYWNVLINKRLRFLFFQPPLTLVNKQVRSETLPVLYGNNKFTVCVKLALLTHADERLKQLWAVPASVLSVSAILHFRYITKLDIWPTSFSDWVLLEPKFRALNNRIGVRMTLRDRKRLDLIMKKKSTVNQHGFWCEVLRILHAAANMYLEDGLLWRPGEEGEGQQLAREEPQSVEAHCLFYFTEICPAAGECVWMGFENTISRESRRP
ncbi:hypothetical protein DHEL01_v208577 [Diaporthe helianthi]|uniref:F-box domain-containing protein n=1 Tax=Diaporthe helianthi TaxID=158607 RepID=A0A2P5HS52_DIAHE|nr:hypothetical protein DHEL01_v208577 [Diaporthe helianthi]